MGHRLSPGAPLAEGEVAEALKVSRTPVRSAFRRLADEGLVTWKPRRGATVTQPTAAEVREVFFVRRTLEGAATALAASAATGRDLDDLDECVRQEVEAFARKDKEGVLDAGRRFHDRVAQIAGNSVLTSTLHVIVARSYVYLLFYDPFDSPTPRSPGEHIEIVSALRSRDPDKARQAMEQHIDSTQDYLDLGLYLRSRDVATALSGGSRQKKED